MFKKIKQNPCAKLNSRYIERMDDKHTVAEYRATYQQQIEAHTKAIAALQEKLRMLDVFAADAKIIFAPENKYEGWTLTPAVLDAVISLHKIGVSAPAGVETFDIYKYLLAHGFKATDNFNVSLYVTLKRLSDKNDGRLIMTKDKYLKKLYKPSEKILGVAAGEPVKQ
jgi:hypothetical protein